MFGLNLSGSSSKTKGTTYIDPKTSAAQWGNYDAAMSGLPQSYAPVNAQDIGGYFSPYEDQVVQQNANDIERSRQMAVNQTADAATAAHAFGGSRHGVAEGQTNDDYARASAQMSATLRNAGWGQALDAAEQQKALQYQYPLSRQQTLNQTVAGITPMKYGQGQDPSAAFSNFGKAIGSAGDVASFIGGFF